MFAVDKNAPPAEWIEQLRKRYPVEPEWDRMLSRKMYAREGGRFLPVSLDQIAQGLNSLLAENIRGAFRVANLAWMTGGASKLQATFDLDWTDDEGRPASGRMVLRMEPAESAVETSRDREFEILRAVEGVIPTPKVYWVDGDARHFPYPCLISGFVSGVVKPTGRSSNVTGIGIQFGPELRGRIGAHFVDDLAALHRWDWRAADLRYMHKPASAQEAGTLAVNLWRRVWEEDSNEDVPIVRLAGQWLSENVPETDHLSIVHSDFRAGNFLFDEATGRVTSWLDWELAYIGDHHADVAFVTLPNMSHLAEDGRTVLVNGLVPEDEYYERYERQSGLTLRKRNLSFYRVLYAYRAAVILLATCYRVVRGGKSHQDLVMLWLMGNAYRNLEDLRLIIEKES